MQTLAQMYKVSDVALRKKCRKFHIPIPSQGYWNKVEAKKPVEPRPPLPTIQIVQKSMVRREGRQHSPRPNACADFHTTLCADISE